MSLVLLFSGSAGVSNPLAPVAVEIRLGDGSDLNSACFVPGSGGTDYTQQVAPHVIFDGSTITASCNAGSNTLNVTGYATAPGDIGNTVNISGGTNFTAKLYQITGQGAGTWTLNKPPAPSGPGSGMIGRMGGAALTPAAPMAFINTDGVGGNWFWLRNNGTWQTAVGLAVNAPAVNTPTPIAPANRISGYGTARGDNGQATIQLITNASLTALLVTTYGWTIEDLVIDANSLSQSQGLQANAEYVTVRRCKIINYTRKGIYLNGSNCDAISNEVTGGNALAVGGAGIVTSGQCTVEDNNVHDNINSGVILLGASTDVLNNRIVNNTGNISDGLVILAQCNVRQNTIHGSGRHNINGPFGNDYNVVIKANILSGAGATGGVGYGCQPFSAAGAPAAFEYDGNAYWSNASGNRNFMDDAGSVNAMNGVAPYTNTLDVILSANPYLNSAGGDFTLNDLTPGGSACRGTAPTSIYPGAAQQSYRDFGAYQHYDSGSGSINVNGITVAITDNGDGSGGTATITGSPAGSTKVLYRSTWLGTMASNMTLANSGTRTGDGTITLLSPGIPLGFYTWQVVNSFGSAFTVGNPVYQNLTTTVTPVHKRVMDAVQVVIQSLGLVGISSVNVVEKWVPRIYDGIESLPAVQIAPIGSETYPGTLTGFDDIGYSVGILMIDKQQSDSVANMSRDLLWRQRLNRAFRKQRLQGVVENITCDVMPGTVIDKSAFQHNYWISILIFHFICREPRGLS